MYRARTVYVPTPSPPIRYRPSDPVVTVHRVPSTLTAPPAMGAPVAASVTRPATAPVSTGAGAGTGSRRTSASWPPAATDTSTAESSRISVNAAATVMSRALSVTGRSTAISHGL